MAYITIGAVVLFLISRFVINPMRDKLDGISSQIDKYDKEIESDRMIRGREKDIIANYETYQPYFTEPDKDSIELGNLVKTVTDIATNSGLTIQNSKQSVEKRERSAYYVVSLESEGRMKQFVSFLVDIHKVQSLVHIEKMELSPKTRRSDTLRAAITISKTSIP